MKADMPSQFLVDIITRCQSKARELDEKLNKTPTMEDLMAMPSVCKFHEHNTEEDKKDCRRYRA
jgi:hypothetical protein